MPMRAATFQPVDWSEITVPRMSDIIRDHPEILGISFGINSRDEAIAKGAIRSDDQEDFFAARIAEGQANEPDRTSF